MSASWRPLLSIGLLLLPGAGARAATYVVDQRHPKAGDENPGTPEAPFKSISRAAALAAPGDTVLIRTGVYRESVTVANAGTAEQPISFLAAPAARVTLTGADLLTDWKREEGPDNVYSAPWPHRFIAWTQRNAHPDDDFHAMIGRAEQVHVAGYPLLQVLSRDKLSRGTFFVDLDARRLYVWSRDNEDVTKLGVDASVRGVVWQSKEYVRVRGLRFRYAANRAQEGAAQFVAHDVVEDCAFERTNSIGAALVGEGIVVRRCTFQENGQMGFSANGAHNLLFTGCVVRGNNTKGWNRGWEAGGNKLCLSRGVVLEKSQFLENRGTGVWFDIGNENCTVRNCLIADNEDAGIFYEISYGLHAHDNVILGNGFADSPGAWGAEAGICLSSSPGCVIERNLLIGNKEGFNFREQLRTTPRIGEKGGNGPTGASDAAPRRGERAVWNHDQTVRNNVIAYNRDAQTWGWFDVNDERHWPAALQEKKSERGKAGADVAAGYGAGDDKGQPAGLSLEKLKIVFSNNLYAIEGQELFHWGTTWKRIKRYADLDAVRAELGLEQGSRCEAFAFSDTLTRDFRVPADSPALKMGCTPQGEVPGVRLGVAE